MALIHAEHCSVEIGSLRKTQVWLGSQECRCVDIEDARSALWLLGSRFTASRRAPPPTSCRSNLLIDPAGSYVCEKE